LEAILIRMLFKDYSKWVFGVGRLNGLRQLVKKMPEIRRQWFRRKCGATLGPKRQDTVPETSTL
jgi:hypothetical protein